MDQFHKIRALAAQGLPVQSRDVRALLEAYDRMAHHVVELTGTIEEYAATPCSYLRIRMFEAARAAR